MTSQSVPLDHSGPLVLSSAECLERFGRAPLGRIAFVANGDPIFLPVNHKLDGDEVVFRTNAGSKLLAADTDSSVAFEVDGFDAELRSGWSVVVRGAASTVQDSQEVARLDTLGIMPLAHASVRTHWVRIGPYGITGRQVVHPH